MDTIALDGCSLGIAGLERLAHAEAQAEVPESAWERIDRARAVVERLLAADQQIYGLTTGVGAFKRYRVAVEDQQDFQERLLLAHATGVGPPLETTVVRAMIAARVNGLATGGAGASSTAVQGLCTLLNRHVHPIVPALGSLGASDLAPNAAVARVLLGHGEAEYRGVRMPAAAALAVAGLRPLRLGAKDGLALISANSLTLGHGALVVAEAMRLIRAFDTAAALTFEGFRANLSILHPAVQRANPHPGQAETAASLCAVLEGSDLWEPGAARNLQDPLSLRCVTPVHGALRQTLDALKRSVEIALNASGDNPLVVVEENRIISNPNFDSTLLALGFDALRLAWVQVGLIAERRIEKLVTTGFSGLPSGLAVGEGVDNGLIIASYTSAALGAELRLLAQPATQGAPQVAEGIEDHVSMAPLSVRRTAEAQRLAARIAALELIIAAEAVDHRGAIHMGHGAQAAYAQVRSLAPAHLGARNWQPEAEAIADLLRGRTGL